MGPSLPVVAGGGVRGLRDEHVRKEKGGRSVLNWVGFLGCSLLRGPCGLSTLDWPDSSTWPVQLPQAPLELISNCQALFSL